MYFFSRKANGDPIRLQVHRDVGDHQLQRGRTTGRHTDADPVEVGPAAGTRRVPDVVDAQTVQVAVGQLRSHVQEVPGLPDVDQPPGQGSAEQSVGQRLEVQIVREPARALTAPFRERAKSMNE